MKGLTKAILHYFGGGWLFEVNQGHTRATVYLGNKKYGDYETLIRKTKNGDYYLITFTFHYIQGVRKHTEQVKVEDIEDIPKTILENIRTLYKEHHPPHTYDAIKPPSRTKVKFLINILEEIEDKYNYPITVSYDNSITLTIPREDTVYYLTLQPFKDSLKIVLESLRNYEKTIEVPVTEENVINTIMFYIEFVKKYGILIKPGKLGVTLDPGSGAST